MANNNTISQIKIGNNFYNIRDAQVREVLSNVTNNIVTVHNFYCSDWSSEWNIYADSKLKETSANRGGNPNDPAEEHWYAGSHRCSLRLYIKNDEDGGSSLYRKYAKWTDNGLRWDGGIVENTPSTVNQCALILQYAFKVTMPTAGYFSSEILRRKIDTENASGIGNNNYCYIQNSTKKTCTKVGDFSSIIWGNNYFFDRIIKKEDEDTDVNGYDYKLAINNYKPASTTTANPQFGGICSTQLLIVQGKSTSKLMPEEEIDSETSQEGENDTTTTS